jgi:hypothetical protein
MKDVSVTLRILREDGDGEELTLDIPEGMDGESLKAWLIREHLLSASSSVEYTVDIRRPLIRMLDPALKDGDTIIIRERLLSPRVRDRRKISGDENEEGP